MGGEHLLGYKSLCLIIQYQVGKGENFMKVFQKDNLNPVYAKYPIYGKCLCSLCNLWKILDYSDFFRQRNLRCLEFVPPS